MTPIAGSSCGRQCFPAMNIADFIDQRDNR